MGEIKYTSNKALASAIVAILTLLGAWAGVEVNIPTETVLTLVLAVNTIAQPFVTWAVRNHVKR